MKNMQFGIDEQIYYELLLAFKVEDLKEIENIWLENNCTNNQELFDNIIINILLNKQLNIIKVLEKCGVDIHQTEEYIFRVAAEIGDYETVKYLVEKGANIEANNNEALIKSATAGKIKVVKLLIKNGADINIVKEFGNRVCQSFVKEEELKKLNIQLNEELEDRVNVSKAKL